jgi:hypothetical protein
VQGPLIAPSKIIGVGGAYTAMAEGIDGAPENAASPAVRNSYSYDWFDWDVDLDASAPGAYGGTDFDNHGASSDERVQSTVNGFLYAHAGVQVQLGALGLSATAELFEYRVTPPPGEGVHGKAVNLVYGRYHALAGYGILDDQIVVGAGARIVTLRLNSAGGSGALGTLAGGTLDTFGGGEQLLALNGAGPEVGAVWKPNALPFRLGATFRSAVGATLGGVTGQVGSFIVPGTGGNISPEGATRHYVDGFVLPAVATLPWELEVGFAVQLGPRPINPPWLDPHDMERPVRRRIDANRAARRAEYARELAGTPPEERATKRRVQEAHEAILRGIEDQELAADSARLRAIRQARERNWPRERITILGSLLVTGPSANAVSLEGFANQVQETVGQSVSLTPRVGVESEPVPNWVHARFGSYLEPSRFPDGAPRQHFTLGGDFRLFPFSPFGIFGDQIWRLTIGADLAPRYQNYGIGLGAWH